MQGILLENKHVEAEMRKRDFQVKDGCWTGGVLLPGDPEDDELEDFLRRQFRQPHPATSDKAARPKYTEDQIALKRLNAMRRKQSAGRKKAADGATRDRRDRACGNFDIVLGPVASISQLPPKNPKKEKQKGKKSATRHTL